MLVVSGAALGGATERAFAQMEPAHDGRLERLAPLAPLMSRVSMDRPKAPVDPTTTPADLRVAFAAAAAWFVVETSVGPPRDPRWSGGILFDDPLRSGVTLDSQSARDDAALASDLTLAATFAPWLLLDVAPAAWRAEARADGWNALLHMTTALAVNDTATTAVKSIAGRQRPFGRKCRTDPRYHDDCGASDENASFFSGHASNAFTGAGMICSYQRSVTDRVLLRGCARHREHDGPPARARGRPLRDRRDRGLGPRLLLAALIGTR